MKLCKKCFRDFDENDKMEDSPARELGDIFISDIGNVDIDTNSLSNNKLI
jgi:hypothetical protein